jgi:hypothetical protein
MFGRSVKANGVERTRMLPGDDLMSAPMASLTHAMTIRCPPHALWPWLAQMGGGRAGWYSYDFIDNGRQPSAGRIVPELQEVTSGMIFPALPGVTEGFTVLAFEPQRLLILGWLSSPDSPPLVTWAFVLEGAGHGETRLIVRARGGRGYQFHKMPWWLTKRIVPVIHFIMQRKQLLGIARRAEGLAANPNMTERASEEGNTDAA